MPSGIFTPGEPGTSGQSNIDLARKIRFGNASSDYSVFNTATQKYESAKTGQPWHGPVVGGFAINGKFSTTPGPGMTDPNAPKPVTFDVTKTVKQPEIATATGNLLQSQQQQASQTGTSFNDFLKQAREINAQSRDQLTKDQAAFDTSKISAALPANDAAYKAAQDKITGDIAARNKTFADTTQSTLDRLTAENKAYESAAQAVADRAVANANKRNSLFQIAGGTPTSGSGAFSNRAIKAYADINTPLQRELSDRRYSQIANIERPYQNQLYGNDLALFGRESGLASDYAGRNENTAKFLQNLQMQVAGMSRAQAQNYLTNLGMPLEIGQKIIAGDISNLAGIQRLDELANYYTVQTPFDASRLPQVQSFPISYPGRSYSPNPNPALPTSSNPITNPGALVSGVDRNGNPRTSALAPDYSSWYTPEMVAARRSAPAITSYPVTNPYYRYGTTGTGYYDDTGKWLNAQN